MSKNILDYQYLQNFLEKQLVYIYFLIIILNFFLNLIGVSDNDQFAINKEFKSFLLKFLFPFEFKKIIFH